MMLQVACRLIAPIASAGACREIERAHVASNALVAARKPVPLPLPLKFYYRSPPPCCFSFIVVQGLRW